MPTGTWKLTLGILAVAALATTVRADHSWGSYHWARVSNPVSLKVGDNLDATWKPYLVTAVGDWDMSSVLALTIVPGLSPKKNCRPTSGRIEVCNAAYGTNGWLGIAQVWANNSHITQATTRVNDTYYRTAVYNKPEWRRYVMCQEVGHDFGLDHQDEDFINANLGTCMDYTNIPGDNQHPSAHDYEQLEEIYSHTDTTTTAGSATLPKEMPPAMGQIAFDTPAQWGRRVYRSPNGRKETYEVDFGRGNKVITHVLWADPVGDAR